GRGGRNGDGQPENIGAWLHIAPNGTVTAFTGKAEMGQNIRTSLTQAVADELRCAPSLVRMTMADTALTPYDMGTFGSRTTPTMAPQLRRMAAAARETLIGLAAHQWGVKASALTVTDGHVRDAASGRSAGFGELAGKADLVRAVAADVAPTPAASWHAAGQSLSKVAARDMVRGRHRYASDIKRPGMLYARVLRPSAFQAKLLSADTAAVEAMPGVKVIRDGEFIGVAAADEHMAEKALAA